jgi:hypothetical protein
MLLAGQGFEQPAQGHQCICRVKSVVVVRLIGGRLRVHFHFNSDGVGGTEHLLCQ